MFRCTSLALFFLAMIGATSLSQTTIHVPAQYKTIQAGIDAAKNGDTVLVAPGVYFEKLSILGKTITLRSAAGARDTIIDGLQQSRVIYVSGASTIDGFTLRNGWAVGSLFNPNGGAGVWAQSGAIIRNNIIIDNQAYGYNFPYPAYGGGVFAGGALVINNVIARNVAAGSMGGEGGGIYGYGTLINNTIFGNRANFRGGGICGQQGTLLAFNCIVAGNSASLSSQIFGSVTTTTCHLFLPLCMDAANGDFHLRYDSPCRDKGTRVTGLPATDFEGDPRAFGSAPDIGADEFHPHVYATGALTPGGIAHVKIIGPPLQATLWAYSLHPSLLNSPIQIPGLGPFYLNTPYWIVPTGKTSSLGVVMLPIPLAPALPKPLDIPIQALVGSSLTNPYIVRIR